MTIESVMVIDDGLDFRKSNTIDTDTKGKDFEQFEIFKFQLPDKTQPVIITKVLENRNARPSWGIDAMLIDEEMLYLDEAEADRVYQELKAKSNRRREMEQRQNRLSSQMSLDEESLQKLTSINSYSESDQVRNFSIRDEDFKKDKSSKDKKEKKDKKESKKTKDVEK